LAAAPYHGAVPRSSWKVWLFLIGVVVLVIGGAFVYLAWRQNVPEGAGGDNALAARHRAEDVAHPRSARGPGRDRVDRDPSRPGAGRAVLANHAFPDQADERRLDLVVDGKSLGLREGAATQVRAGDGFWRPCARTIARCCRRR
jgi:hypothetical protein